MGAIVVFAFFAFLLHSAQDMAVKPKAPPSASLTIEKRGDTAISVSPRAFSLSDEDDAAAADIATATRLSELLSATRRYADDHQGSLPPMDTPQALHDALSPQYVSGDGIFQSPNGGEKYLSNPALSGKALNSFSKPAEVIAFYEPLVSTGLEQEKPRAVLFLDGSLHRLKPLEWDALRQKAGLP